MKKSELILCTYDARLTELKIIPKCGSTKADYKLNMYDEITGEKKVQICLEDVCAVKFSMNYFDNPIGAEVCGLYEIFEREKKEDLIESNFILRKENTLYHGDYDYDPDDSYDWLNNRDNINDVLEKINDYHLIEQVTTGGSYFFLCKKITVK